MAHCALVAVCLLLSAGTIKANTCSSDQVWVTEQKECRGSYPELSGRPMISYPMVTTTTVTHGSETIDVSRFVFKCFIEGYPKQTEPDGAMFEVTFHLDGAPMEKSFETDSTLLVVEMGEEFMVENLGHTVSCSVKSFWSGHRDQMSASVPGWNGFWAGIKPELEPEKKKTVNEVETLDGPFTIDFKSTIPVTCPYCADSESFVGQRLRCRNCHYRVSTKHDGLATSCEMKFSEDDTTFPLTYEIQVTEGIRPPGTEVKIGFYQFAPLFPPSISHVFQNYVIDPVTVHIVDEVRAGECRLVTDPHVTTFDSKYYEAYRPGDYYLWLWEEQQLEIQGRFKPCGSASCTCGVIIRERNAVVGVDQCDGTTPRVVEHLVDGTALKKPVITTSNNGRTITITMPSGVRVQTYRGSSSGMSSYIYAPSSYKNRQGTGGLCGNYNDDPDDDLRIRNSTVIDNKHRPIDFKNSWRIPPANNYFENPPTCRDLDAAPDWLCRCGDDYIPVCDVPSGPGYRVPLSVFGGPPVCGGSVRNKRASDDDNQGGRAQRSTSTNPQDIDLGDDFIDPNDLYRAQDFDPDHGVDVPEGFPSNSGITRDAAGSACTNEIQKSAVYDFCEDVISDEMVKIHEECLGDILLLDNLTAAVGFGSELESNCLFQVQAAQNISDDEMVRDEETGDLIPKEIQELLQKICPNQCSSRGECINGSCHCESDFAGVDCSVDTTIPPQLLAIQSSLCDVRSRGCRSSRLYGSNILNSDALECVVTSASQLGSYTDPPAKYVSTEEVICAIPPSPVHTPPGARSDQRRKRAVLDNSPSVTAVQHTWLMSVSNDGNSFSSQLEMMVYDSLCQNCTGIGSCTHKSGSCNIDQVCHDDLDLNPRDLCQQCHPKKSIDKWQVIENNQKPGLETGDLSKVRDELLSVQLNASDPEGHAVSFHLMSGVSVTVSMTGLLEWSEGHNTDQEVVMRLVDECGAESLAALELTVTESDTSPSPDTPDDGVNMGLIVGLTVGGAAIALVIITVSIIVMKNNTKPNKVTDSYQDLVTAQSKNGSRSNFSASSGSSSGRSTMTAVSTSHGTPTW